MKSNRKSKTSPGRLHTAATLYHLKNSIVGLLQFLSAHLSGGLTVLPRPPSWILEREGERKGEGAGESGSRKGEEERKGKGGICGRNLFFNYIIQASIRGLATPWTYFLHLSLSSVILIDFSTGSPVHILMLSIQAMCGLPRLRAPGIIPCIISFSRQLPCFLTV